MLMGTIFRRSLGVSALLQERYPIKNTLVPTTHFVLGQIKPTPTQTYNRNLLYNVVVVAPILSTTKFKKLEWRDIQPHEILSKDEQKRHHLIRIRRGCQNRFPRTVQSPTVEYFNRMRVLAGSKFTEITFPSYPEYLNHPVFAKYGGKGERFGRVVGISIG